MMLKHPSKKMASQSLLNNIGFTLVELMIAVAIIGVLALIAIPAYRGYITRAKQSAAWAVTEQLPVLAETYRADNGGILCPGCIANGTYTYEYKEDDNGNVTTDTITPAFPGFQAKGTSQKTASLYDYKVVFVVAGCPACTTTATVTATPIASRNAPAGDLVGNPFN